MSFDKPYKSDKANQAIAASRAVEARHDATRHDIAEKNKEHRRNTLVTIGTIGATAAGVVIAAKFGAFDRSLELDTEIGVTPTSTTEVAPEPQVDSTQPIVDLESNTVTLPTPEK